MIRGLRRHSLLPAALIGLASIVSLSRGEEPTGPLGFSRSSRAAQTQAEAHALDVPTAERARAWLRALTEEPHVAGTPADHRTALFVRDKLREWGWKADLVEYEVLLNYPAAFTGPGGVNVAANLELTRPQAKKLSVMEDPVALDKDSASLAAFPAFHGYGISGDVRGQVVYANLARIEDFAALEKMGVDVKDKIVLARYGGLFRGLKLRNAQKRGARGILIYSDPADDGFARGEVYPNGPFRPASAIQRGSVQFLSQGPGDPSTPGFASVKGVKNRLEIDAINGFPIAGSFNSIDTREVATPFKDVNLWEKSTGLVRNDYFAAIPSLPISYDAAKPILEALGGPNVPAGWQGGLPFPYHVGPGPAEVHFSITMNYQIRTIWNVMATISGAVEPDRWVMIGNHRDAWVYGAVDPGSGTAATMETCRALGAAIKNGWKPRRTLVYSSWDAEEYGLVGSTEFAEDHAKELDAKAVMMLNVDMAVAGPEPGLDLEGIPSLRDFILDAADAVADPRKGGSLKASWMNEEKGKWSEAPLDLDGRLWTANGSFEAPARPRFSPQMGSLGSGSDYTSFVDHLGIPAVDINFYGKYGVYHSVYDNFHWMEKFGDPEFLTHATAARLYTLIAMRAAAAEVFPYRFVPYGQALRTHVDELRRMIDRKGRGADPGKSRPSLVFSGLPELVKSVRAFQDRASELDRATEALSRREKVADAQLSRVNDSLQRIERAFLRPAGLPGRPWFKHTIYAPGLTTGYASWPLPGIRQAVEDDDQKLLAEQVAALVERIDAASAAIATASKAATEAR